MEGLSPKLSPRAGVWGPVVGELTEQIIWGVGEQGLHGGRGCCEMLVGSWPVSDARLRELVLVSEPLLLDVKGFRGAQMGGMWPSRPERAVRMRPSWGNTAGGHFRTKEKHPEAHDLNRSNGYSWGRALRETLIFFFFN